MLNKIFAIVGILLVMSPVFAFNVQTHTFTTFKEKIILVFTFDEKKRAEKMLDFAQKRIDATESTDDPRLKNKLVEEYKNYVEQAENIAENSNDSDFKNRIDDEKARQIASLEKVYEQVPDKAKYNIELIIDERIDEQDVREQLSQRQIQKAEEIASKRDLPRLEIGSIEKEARRNEDLGVCIQVIQPAKNKVTGECREFSTPCAVPSGWDKVSSCVGINDINIATPTADPSMQTEGKSPPNFPSGVESRSGAGAKAEVPSTGSNNALGKIL